MIEDVFYNQLVDKMTEVSAIKPQSVGPFTGIYKRITPLVKEKPYKALSLGSLFSAAFLYLLFGSLLVKLASILQYGF